MQQTDSVPQKLETSGDSLKKTETSLSIDSPDVQSSVNTIPDTSQEVQPIPSVPETVEQPKVIHFEPHLVASSEDALFNHSPIINTSDSTAVELQLPPPLMRNKNSAFWEVPLLLICILGIVLVRVLNQRRFSLLSKSVFNIRVVPQYLREENAFSNQVISVLSFGFVIISSLLALQLVRHWIPISALKPFQLFSRLCFFIVLVYISKFAVLELISEIFDAEQIVKEYIYNVLLFNSLIGICLIPIVLTNALLLEYESLFAAIGIVVIAVIYVFRNWRAISLGRMHKYPAYYIFLYLCTLEILPGLILIKLLKQQLI